MIVTPGRAAGFGANVDAGWDRGAWLEGPQSARVDRSQRPWGEQQSCGEKSGVGFLGV
jgi:hypothetical protein